MEQESGVRHEIAGQIKLIGVCIHKYRFEASLEKMPTPVHTPVDPAGVTETEILHNTG